MRNIDVSAVLNIHREAIYLRATLLSLEACAVEARKANISVELIAVFDRADHETLAVFHQTPLIAFEQVKIVEIDVGSLGLARNAGIQEAKGEFVWTCDGDDLVSRNSIVELVKTARNHPSQKIAVFLEYLAAFGENYHVARYVGSEWLTAADFAYQHPYVSRIFIKRSAFDTLCYLNLKVTAGFAYEDWDLNSRLFVTGFEFAIASDTILFYRQRGNSLLRQANATSAKITPHSALFEPKTYGASMASAREKKADWHAFIRERQRLSETNFSQQLMAVESLVDYVAEACQLDPEVEPARIETASSYCPVPWDPKHWGFQLEGFYQLLGSERFSDVLLLPWLKPGGAEKYILEILDQLHRTDPTRRTLMITGEAATQHESMEGLPKEAVFVDLFNAFPTLDEAGRDAMLARALLAVADHGARLHVKASLFSHRMMDRYGAVFSSRYKVIYYRFSDEIYIWRRKHFISAWGINFMRRQLPNIDLFISDCHSIFSSDSAHLGTQLEKCQTIYAKCSSSNSPPTRHSPMWRLLWASRVSASKRPELVTSITTALRFNYPEIVIEVYGQADDHYQPELLFGVPGVEYRGSFNRFDNLPIERFDAFVYTSRFDGMPNVVLEAMASGLPVIAPDVGGLGEAVIDGETGFLVPDLVDENALIQAYVDAVCRLYGNWGRTSEIADNGQRLIAERHGELDFQRRVAEVFEIDTIGMGAIL